jgi:hypothetical protein
MLVSDNENITDIRVVVGGAQDAGYGIVTRAAVSQLSDSCVAFRETLQLASIPETDGRDLIDLDQAVPPQLGECPAHRLNRKTQEIRDIGTCDG